MENSNEDQVRQSRWEKQIPWYVTITSTLTLIVIGYFLLSNIEWFKQNVFSSQVVERNTPEYRFYAYHMHLSMIKRSVGLFSGFAMMFLGMGVAFYSMKEKTTGELKSASVTASIATASPGIIAILVGGYLIISSIQSKDEFPSYNGNSANKEEPYRPKKPD